MTCQKTNDRDLAGYFGCLHRIVQSFSSNYFQQLIGIYPAKAYDKHDNVLYCSSFSKTLVPCFGIGWVSAGKHHAALEKLKFGSNTLTNSVLQNAIGRCLESGQYDKHPRKMRLAIQSQMISYLGTITSCFSRK